MSNFSEVVHKIREMIFMTMEEAIETENIGWFKLAKKYAGIESSCAICTHCSTDMVMLFCFHKLCVACYRKTKRCPYCKRKLKTNGFKKRKGNPVRNRLTNPMFDIFPSLTLSYLFPSVFLIRAM